MGVTMNEIKIEIPTEAIQKTIAEAYIQALTNWIKGNKKPPTLKPYMTYKETAELLDVSEDTIRKWIKEEGLEVISVSHSIKRIDLNDLRKFLELRKEVLFIN